MSVQKACLQAVGALEQKWRGEVHCEMKKLTGASLAKHEVIGAEELTERTSTNRVHGSGLQVHQDRAGHVASACNVSIRAIVRKVKSE